MKQQTARAQRCQVIGCSNPATVRVIPQFKAPALIMCDQCKPDPQNRPEELREFPFAYEIEPLPGILPKERIGKVTVKEMQLHGECRCGANYVEPISEPIPYRAFSALGVKVRNDRQTGERFLLKIEHYQTCERCQP